MGEKVELSNFSGQVLSGLHCQEMSGVTAHYRILTALTTWVHILM